MALNKCCERSEQRHISDGLRVDSIPRICASKNRDVFGTYVRTFIRMLAEDFEPRIHARSSHVQENSASKKRQHLCMEFMPEVLFST